MDFMPFVNINKADISTTPGWLQEISWNHPGVVARDLLEPPPLPLYTGLRTMYLMLFIPERFVSCNLFV